MAVCLYFILQRFYPLLVFYILFFTSILANLFLKEKIDMELILSSTIIALELSIFYYGELRQGYTKEV